MKDVNELKKLLLFSDWEEAKTIYNAALAVGHAPIMAAAITYKSGYLAGKAQQKENLKKTYRELAIAKERIGELETKATQERIAYLLEHPAPDLKIEDVLAEIDNSDTKPTPGEKQEAETNE